MKTLLTNGCSWTYGGGLDITEEQNRVRPYVVWPNQLKELMQFDNCVNLAMGCGSNQRILRTTTNWLLKQDKEVLKNTTAVIQWTELSRYEYYYPTTDDPYDDIEENWALVKAGVLICEPNKDYHSNTELDKSQRRYETMTELEILYTHLSHVEAMTSLFNSFGVKHYYWNFVTPYHLTHHHIKDFILSRYNWLEPYGRHTWDYERIGSHDPHPSVLGHKQIAIHIKQAIEKLYGESCTI